jgi:hypothetical protein
VTTDDNPFTYYNAGLMYFELKKYDKSLQQAHRAYELGFVRPDLRNALKNVGKWVEPDATASAADPASSAASTASAPAIR